MVFLVLLFIGSVVQGVHLNIVWLIGDTANAFMAFPNLLSLILLTGLLGKTTRDYFYKKKETRL
jgi:AGCS family alanine or glycine:cation symporter